MNDTIPSQRISPTDQAYLDFIADDYISTNPSQDELLDEYIQDVLQEAKSLTKQEIEDVHDLMSGKKKAKPLNGNTIDEFYGIMAGSNGIGDKIDLSSRGTMIRNDTSAPPQANTSVENNAAYIADLQRLATEAAPIGRHDFKLSGTGNYADPELFDGTRIEGRLGPAGIAAMAKQIHQPHEGWEDLREQVDKTYPEARGGSVTGAPELLAAQSNPDTLSIAQIEEIVGNSGHEMNLLEACSVRIRAYRKENAGMPRSDIEARVADFLKAAEASRMSKDDFEVAA